MTEADWLVSNDLWEMFKHTQAWISDRKQRLVAVASCRCLDELLVNKDIQQALQAAELYADGLLDTTTLETWHTKSLDIAEQLGHSVLSPRYMAYTSVASTARPGPYSASLSGVAGGVSQAIACWSGESWGTPPWEEVQQRAATYMAGLVREILGNPFWPVNFKPEWRTSDVMALATGIYDEKAFDRMPILADALQDAGCENADILNHLRDHNATHVRGCWALDLVLGKE